MFKRSPRKSNPDSRGNDAPPAFTTPSSNSRRSLKNVPRRASQSVVELMQMSNQDVGRSQEQVSQSDIKVAFERCASINEPHDEISFDEFKTVCDELHVGLNDVELQRMFTNMATNGVMNYSQFCSAVKRWRFLSSIVSSYAVDDKFQVKPDFDITKSTNVNYGVDNQEFYGKYKILRATLDYSFHTNYTQDRQLWQDQIIQSIVTRTTPLARPWLIYTSGPPGAGKTYTLSWMSQHGYFPLENIVRVDPDQFKQVMPEWKLLIERNQTEAAHLCHRESGFMAELAQLVAMSSSQNVWVDTTLKDYKWFGKCFDNYRAQYKHYRIAIFYITTTEEEVWRRVEARAKATGRKVPDDQIKFALNDLPKALEYLTPKADLVTRISNNEDKAAPHLQAVQIVDSSGSWNIIRNNFARMEPSPHEFPESLAPLSVVATKITKDHLSFDDLPVEGTKSARRRKKKKNEPEASTKMRIAILDPSFFSVSKVLKEVEALASNISLYISPKFNVNLDRDSKRVALIPDAARSFVWLYPAGGLNEEHLRRFNSEESGHEEIQLLLYGGFIYFNGNDEVIQVNAATAFRQDKMIQFGPPQELDAEACEYLELRYRWRPVTVKFLNSAGAVKFAWILPGETMPKKAVSRFGAFAYEFEDGTAKYYPVASGTWDTYEY